MELVYSCSNSIIVVAFLVILVVVIVLDISKGPFLNCSREILSYIDEQFQ